MHDYDRTQFNDFCWKTHWILTRYHDRYTLMTHLTDSCSNRAYKFLVIHVLMCFIKDNKFVECTSINLHDRREDIEHNDEQAKSLVLFDELITKVNNDQSSWFQILLQLVAIGNIFFCKIKFLLCKRTL